METVNTLSVLALLAAAGGILSLLSLLVLHFVSPEYQPSWRMVSEYALGKHKWLLTLFFISWGISTLAVACLLWNLVSSNAALVGVLLIFISGLGAMMGGLFDIRHKYHGLAFGLGVPTLPIGSLLVSYNLVNAGAWDGCGSTILVSAHTVWISLVLMAITMVVMMSGFKKSGLPMGPGAEVPLNLPPGVVGLNGYANRLLVVCYEAWAIIVAIAFLSM